MVDDKLVREIAKLVSRKLLEYQKNAMVVFTGTTIGTDVALEALCDLKEQGFTYHVLLSHSASKVLDVEKIRASLKPEDLWLGCSERTPEDLCSKYETILVPALTINSAARVANCMSDTVATSIILNGLLRRKTVVLSIDGCCPDVQKQINGGVPLPPILEGRLRSNLELLQGYGAILTKSSDMSSTVQKAIREAIRFMPAPARTVKQAVREISRERTAGHNMLFKKSCFCPRRAGMSWEECPSHKTRINCDTVGKRGCPRKSCND